MKLTEYELFLISLVLDTFIKGGNLYDFISDEGLKKIIEVSIKLSIYFIPDINLNSEDKIKLMNKIFKELKNRKPSK